MFGLESLLAGVGGKIALALGAVLAVLGYGWRKKRQGLQEAAQAAKERERSAIEEVLRQRGRAGPGPAGGGVRPVDKPIRGFASPPEDRKPKAGAGPD